MYRGVHAFAGRCGGRNFVSSERAFVGDELDLRQLVAAPKPRRTCARFKNELKGREGAGSSSDGMRSRIPRRTLNEFGVRFVNRTV